MQLLMLNLIRSSRLSVRAVALILMLLPMAQALGQTPLQEKTVIPIDWECEFYFNQLLTPADITRQHSTTHTVEKIPNSWTTYRNEKNDPLPAHSYATYRILCPVKNPGRSQRLALYLPLIHSSYTLWINGAEEYHSGKVSAVPFEESPRASKAIIPFSLPAGTPGAVDTVEIVLQVSNFNFPKAGVVFAPRLGDYETIVAEQGRANMPVNILLGLLLTLLIAHIALYTLVQNLKTHVWTSVLLLFLMLSVITVPTSQLLQIFPSMGWNLYYSLHAAGRLGSMAALLMLLHNRYPYSFPTTLAYPLAALGGLATILTTLLPASLYISAYAIGIAYLVAGLGIAIVWVLPRAIKKQRHLAVGTLIGLVVLGISLAIDYINASHGDTSHPPYSLLTVGILAVLFTGEIVLETSNSVKKMRSLVINIRSRYQSHYGDNQKLTEELRREQSQRKSLEEAAERRQWSDEGERQLHQVIIKNLDDLQALCQSSLEKIAKYLKSKVGLLYIARLSPETNELGLVLFASYGLDTAQRAKYETCAIGEGIVGACFLDNTARIINDVPKTVVKVNSGLGRAVPKSLAVQPLESDSGLVGIMEFGRFESYKEHEEEFLKRSALQLANSIMHVNSNEGSRKRIEQLTEALKNATGVHSATENRC